MGCLEERVKIENTKNTNLHFFPLTIESLRDSTGESIKWRFILKPAGEGVDWRDLATHFT